MRQSIMMKEAIPYFAASRSPYFSMPNMRSLGYFNIDGVHIGGKEANQKVHLPD